MKILVFVNGMTLSEQLTSLLIINHYVQDVRNNPALLKQAKAATVEDGKSAKEESKEKRRQKATGMLIWWAICVT